RARRVMALLLVSILLSSAGLTVPAALAAGCASAFSTPSGSPFSVGGSPRGMATGKLNGDSIPDLVVTDSAISAITVLLGNGSGGFTQAAGSPVSVGSGPQAVALGRFNDD